MHATLPLMNEFAFPAIDRRRTETLQVNLGYKCNQTCVACIGAWSFFVLSR